MNPIPKSIFPIRYTGGKSKVLPALHAQLPQQVDEFRDVFTGGGSFTLSMMWRNKNAKFWMNDGNPVVYAFWKNLHKHPQKMQKWIRQKRLEHPAVEDGEKLYQWCCEKIKTADDFESGCIWFILNRIAFNGSSTYSGTEYFTEKRIDQLKCCGDLMRSVDLTITNHDYSVLLSSSTKNVLLFLDPPYELGSTFYYGDLHRQFDHDVFSLVVKDTPHKWMLTYNDEPEIRQRFEGFNFLPLQMPYKKNGQPVTEIIIKNY